MTYRIRRDDDESPHNHAHHSSESWERETLRDVLLAAYQEQRRARFWRNLWRGVGAVMFGVVLLGSVGGGKNDGKSSARVSDSSPHTAVINLTGEIGGSSENDQVELLRDGIESAFQNKNAKAILIHANSPGGSPVISNTAYNEIRFLKQKYKDQKKPIYVVVGDVCASGCYYIAAAADKIYADPTSLVGSIGVVGSSFDATGLMEKLGIKRRQHTAGSNKGMGDPFSPETPEQNAIWQQMLGQIHAEFIKAVRDGRGDLIQEAQFPDVFSGRVYTGLESKQVGLIDDWGNVYSVARDVVKTPELVDYTPEQDDFARLLGRRFGAEMKAKLFDSVNKIW